MLSTPLSLEAFASALCIQVASAAGFHGSPSFNGLLQGRFSSFLWLIPESSRAVTLQAVIVLCLQG